MVETNVRKRLRVGDVLAVAVLAASLVFNWSFAKGFNPPGPPTSSEPLSEPPTEALSEPPRAEPIEPRSPGLGPGIAIIIDDFGWGASGTKEALRLPPEVTVAVIPSGPTAARDAQAAEAAGHDVLLHLPLEPLSGSKMGPAKNRDMFITTDMADQEIEESVEKWLKDVPGAIGLNNHMGSKATADLRVAKALARAAKRLNLVVVDSRTSPRSLLYRCAVEAGVQAGQNELFIDNVKQPEKIKTQLLEAARIARSKGRGIIVIGHVHPTTARAIEESLPELKRQGLRLVSVKQLLLAQKRGG